MPGRVTGYQVFIYLLGFFPHKITTFVPFFTISSNFFIERSILHQSPCWKPTFHEKGKGRKILIKFLIKFFDTTFFHDLFTNLLPGYPTTRAGNFITRLLPGHLLPGPGIAKPRTDGET